jgi:hypothetical protein
MHVTNGLLIAKSDLDLLDLHEHELLLRESFGGIQNLDYLVEAFTNSISFIRAQFEGAHQGRIAWWQLEIQLHSFELRVKASHFVEGELIVLKSGLELILGHHIIVSLITKWVNKGLLLLILVEVTRGPRKHIRI